jgi:prephenate dehydrogenase
MPQAAPFAKIGVVGLGLMGGSIALAARRAWPDVQLVGFDHAPRTAEAARGQIVHEIAADLRDLASCELVVLAMPLAAIIDCLPLLAAVRTRATITDVGSTKRQVMAGASAAGLSSFVGGHPMGGSEGSGLEHARADLFDGRPWLLVAGGDDAHAAARVEQFVSALGGLPQWTDADTHDRTMAYVSHLPQLLAVALMNATEEAVGDRGISASGRAFSEMTRLASSPADLWQGILSRNADFVAEALRTFTSSLPTGADLEGGRWIQDAFARARRSRPHGADRPPRKR